MGGSGAILLPIRKSNMADRPSTDSQTPLLCPNLGACSLENWLLRPCANEPVLVMRQAWKESTLEGGTVRFAWNGEALLVHAILPDRDIFNPVTEFNEPAYLTGDVFEIFLRPTTQTAYYEFHVSPCNQRFQVRFPKSKADAEPGETVTATPVTPPIESVVQIDRQNDRWEVFAAIPLTLICESESGRAGTQLLASFSRYDYTRTPGGITAELFSTSPHRELSFHRQQEWSLVKLGH